MLKSQMEELHSPPSTAMISIDLEDWHQLMHRKLTGELIPASKHVVDQTKRALDVLDSIDAKATFFVLGLIARQYPQLVREISDRGHEIGTHSMNHPLLYGLSRENFKIELSESIKLLEDISSQKILGFRAPEFSINERNLELLGVLVELGMAYDSSIFPVRAKRYGYPSFPKNLTRLTFAEGAIVEIPLTGLQWAGKSIPIAGGGYFRLFPGRFLRWALRKVQAANQPICLYFHPYEFSPEYLDVSETRPSIGQLRRWRANLPQNLGRTSIIKKISSLQSVLQFRLCREVVHELNESQGQKVLRTYSA